MLRVRRNCSVRAFEQNSGIAIEFSDRSFYRAALNAGRSSREKGVCQSVRTKTKRLLIGK